MWLKIIYDVLKLVLIGLHILQFKFNNPADKPTSTVQTAIKLNSYTKIEVTPNVKKISTDLQFRPSNIRKCYLVHERKLAIYRQYTSSNCMSECYINATLSKCGCVDFYALR